MGQYAYLQAYCGEFEEDTARVEMSPARAKELLALIEQAKSLKEANDNFSEIRFWDCSCEYFVREARGSPVPESMFKDLDNGCVVFPNLRKERLGIDDTSQVTIARTECDELVATPDDVYWACILKHTSQYVTTTRLTEEALREYLDS